MLPVIARLGYWFGYGTAMKDGDCPALPVHHPLGELPSAKPTAVVFLTAIALSTSSTSPS